MNRTLSDATTPGQSGSGSDAMEYFTFPEAPALQKPHYPIVLCHIQDTRWIEGVQPLCRDAGGVFGSPSQLSLQVCKRIKLNI